MGTTNTYLCKFYFESAKDEGGGDRGCKDIINQIPPY